MTAISNPDKNQILANINKLRESTTPPTDPHSAAPAPMPGHFSPQPATFRKGGIVDKATEVTLTDADKDLTDFLDGLPMMDALKAWGKPQKTYRSVGPQSVLIRCPKPEHPDNNPSASCDLVEGVYRCHSCLEGGDRYTMAAIHHGFNMATHQDGKNFRDLKKKMALDLGYTITESAGTTTLKAPTPAPPANPAPASNLVHLEDDNWLDPATGELVNPPSVQPVELPAPEVSATPFQPTPTPVPVTFGSDEEEEEEGVGVRVKPKLDWVPLGKNRSFIDTYMNAVERDEYPSEFAFASALICLSFVAGRHIKLKAKRNVVAPLGIVTVAGTGVGKTRALNDALKVLKEVMPWKGAELAIGSGGQVVPGNGVKSVKGVGSGENLIRQFQDIVKVPKGVDGNGEPMYEEVESPVNGVISFNELSQFVGKASLTGSTLRERMFDFIDFADEVKSSSNTAGSYRAVWPYACLYSSIQPSIIHKVLTESDEHSGQLNRFLFFTGEPKKADHTDLTPIDLTPAIDRFKELNNYWSTKGDLVIDYTDDALKMMADYLDSTLVPLERSGSGLLGRLRVTFWKMLLLICINEMSDVVTPDIIEKGKRLMTYLTATYGYVSGELYDPSGLHDENNLDDLIVARVRKLQKKAIDAGVEGVEDAAVTATDIRRGVDRQLKKMSSSPTQFLNRTIAALVELGALGKVNTGRGARYYAP